MRSIALPAMRCLKVEEALRVHRAARFGAVLDHIQAYAKAKGLDRITEEEIEAEIIEEYAGVLHRPRLALPPRDVDELIALIGILHLPRQERAPSLHKRRIYAP